MIKVDDFGVVEVWTTLSLLIFKFLVCWSAQNFENSSDKIIVNPRF